MDANAEVYVDKSYEQDAENLAEKIRTANVKPDDAIHTAYAIIAECDYMLSTDDGLLKYKTDTLILLDPVDFIWRMGGEDNE